MINLKINKKLLILLSVLVIAGGYFFYQIFWPLRNSPDFVLRINKGDTLSKITDILKENNLIRNERIFKGYAVFFGYDHKIKKGDYRFSNFVSPAKILQIITRKFSDIAITIPEGLNLKEIQAKLSEYNFSYASSAPIILTKFKVRDFKNDFDFFDGAPVNTNLEGYLFPDTYRFNPDSLPQDLVKVFLRNFDAKLSQDLRQEIARQNKNIYKITTMASIIEKEVIKNEDRKIVSDILWRRLKAGIALQADATIVYAKGINLKKGERVLLEDLDFKSVYNTYLYRGLPPGPISNPGLESIKAAIYPQKSDYWYYLSTPDGKTIFSKTLEEHNAAKAKYLK